MSVNPTARRRAWEPQRVPAAWHDGSDRPASQETAAAPGDGAVRGRGHGSRLVGRGERDGSDVTVRRGMATSPCILFRHGRWNPIVCPCNEIKIRILLQRKDINACQIRRV